MSVNNRRNALKKIGAGSALSANTLKWVIPSVSVVSLPVHATTSPTPRPTSTPTTTEGPGTTPDPVSEITVDIGTCADFQTNKEQAGFTYQLFSTPQGSIDVSGDSFSGSIVLEVEVEIALGGSTLSTQTETVVITGPGTFNYTLDSMSSGTQDGGFLPRVLTESVRVSVVTNSTNPRVEVNLPSPTVRSATVDVITEILPDGTMEDAAGIENNQIPSCV